MQTVETAKVKWAARKAARRELAAERTGWNTYSIHDRREGTRRIVQMFKLWNEKNEKRGLPLKTGFDAYEANRRAENKYRTFRGDRSRYVPHQGPKECERRRLSAGYCCG